MVDIIVAIVGFFMSVFNAIRTAISQIFLLFSALILGVLLQVPLITGNHMLTGDDLTDYHAIGDVWQETYEVEASSADEDQVSSIVLEFEFLEATNEYVKVNIKCVSLANISDKEDIVFVIGCLRWERVVDDMGNDYEMTGKKNIFNYFENIPVDEDGVTVYMYYSFKTKIPAGYIKAKIDRQGLMRDTYRISIYPHE